MSDNVYVTAQFKAKPGQEKALIAVLEGLIPATLKEAGCVQYTLTKRLPSPYAEGESENIVFNEVWADNASFEAHCEQPYIKEFFEKYCLADDGLAQSWNVCAFTDELAS